MDTLGHRAAKEEHVIPVVLPSGKEILLASSSADVPGVAADEAPYKDVSFRPDFRELVDVAAEIGHLLREGVEKIRPNKATVELSVGIDAKSGMITAFFVEGGANGAIKICLEWAQTGPSS
jgi:Trypsin-co-occurring domain 1